MKFIRLTTLILMFALAGCSNPFNAGSSSVDGNYQAGAPAVPPGSFSVTAVPGNLEVALAWGSSVGASSYVVKYGTTNGSYSTTFTTTSSISATVTGLTNSTLYYFQVTAVGPKAQTSAEAVSSIPSQPTITAIDDQLSLGMTTAWSGVIPFQLSGAPGMTCAASVIATSTNAAVISAASISVSGTYPNCVATFAVGAGVVGSTHLSLTVQYGSAVASRTFAYNILSAASFAFSLRKIVAGYGGSAIDVRRSSDNTVQSIGFTTAGSLDAASLNAFCGTASCYISQWYDQSGGGHHVIQSTAANQPQLVNAGAIIAANGVPSLLFNGTTQVLKTTVSNLPSGSSARSINAVYQTLSSSNMGVAGHGDPGVGSQCILYSFGGSDPFASGFVRDVASGFASTLFLKTSTITFSGSVFSTFKDGAAGASVNIGSLNTAATTTLGIGAGTAFVSDYFDGKISEAVMFASELSTADRQLLERNQGRFFGITVL